MKRTMVCLLAAFVGISVLVIPTLSEAQAVKLQIASWNVPKDPNTKALETIAADLKEVTNGMVTSEISFKALGKPDDYYDAVAKGICDIAYIGLPYSPGRFPVSEVLGLPISFPNNVITTKVLFQLWKKGYLDKEFSDVRPVSVGSTSPYVFYWGKKEPITTIAAFKGKKIRSPGGPWTSLTEALGSTPVSVDVAESYIAVQKGIIDGILQTWPATPVFKLNEVCKAITDVSLCGFAFLIAINQDTYKKLPQEARSLLDKNTEKYSLLMANAHQGFNEVGMKMMTEAGARIDTLPPAELAEMRKRAKPIFAKWASDMESRKLPGKKILDEVHSILQDLGVKEAFER